QSGAVTIPDLIKARFRSDSVGMTATLLVLFFMFFYLLAQFKAGSKIMTTLLQDVAIYQLAVNVVGSAIDGLPWIGNAEPDYVLCLLVFAFSVIVYTAFGGFRAVVWTDVMQGIVMGVGVIILLYLTLVQVGGLTKATEQLKEMTPPETGIGIVTLGQAHTETITLPKGGWLRLSDGGIARLAEQASLAKGETRTEAKLLKITTPAEVDRIEPTDFGFTVTSTFTADKTKGYGSGRKGVYVSAPGPHPEREDGFLNVWIAISFFFFWAFGSAGQPSNMVRLMAFKGTNVLRNAILAVSVYYTVIYLLLVVIFCCARILLPGMEVDSDRIMPELAAKVTGDAGVPWLAGLLLAAPFAAVMSSVDSFLLMVSSAVVRDIYQNRVNPNASEKRLKRLSYLVTAVVGILAMLAVLNPPQYLQDLIVFATSGLAGCFLMPVLLGLYWPQISAKGAIAGMLGGLSCHLSLYISGYVIKGKFEAFKMLEFDPFIWSLVVSGLLCWGVSPSQAKPPKNI
ncbi:MAG: hypothetical protein HN607_01645, partial [Verrucomicrobia bacterium]|nr:hypothetical protein [Verrucomicrobiota bacterium]